MFFFLSCFFVPVFAFSFFLHLSFCLSAFRSFCLSVHFFLLTSHFLSLAANLLFGLLWIFFGISEVRIVCHHFRFWQQRTERAPTHRAKKKTPIRKIISYLIVTPNRTEQCPSPTRNSIHTILDLQLLQGWSRASGAPRNPWRWRWQTRRPPDCLNLGLIAAKLFGVQKQTPARIWVTPNSASICLLQLSLQLYFSCKQSVFRTVFWEGYQNDQNAASWTVSRFFGGVQCPTINHHKCFGFSSVAA